MSFAIRGRPSKRSSSCYMRSICSLFHVLPYPFAVGRGETGWAASCRSLFRTKWCAFLSCCDSPLWVRNFWCHKSHRTSEFIGLHWPGHFGMWQSAACLDLYSFLQREKTNKIFASLWWICACCSALFMLNSIQLPCPWRHKLHVGLSNGRDSVISGTRAQAKPVSAVAESVAVSIAGSSERSPLAVWNQRWWAGLCPSKFGVSVSIARSSSRIPWLAEARGGVRGCSHLPAGTTWWVYIGSHSLH